MTPTIPEMMRAAVLRDVVDGMKVEIIRTLRPRTGKVLVEVSTYGMCRSDLHAISGAVASPTPYILGHGATDEMAEIGSHNEYSGLAVGDRAAEGSPMPCGQRESCATGRDNLCELFFSLNRFKGYLYDDIARLFDFDGNPTWTYSMGRPAKYHIVPSASVAKLPGGVGPVTGAILGYAAMTVYSTVWRSTGLRYDETVTVVTIGGVGSNVIQVAKVFGAHQIAVINVANGKLAAAVELGAAGTVNPAKVNAREAVMELTGGQGVGVVFEVLGRPQTWLTALNVLRDGGRTVPTGLDVGVQKVEVEINRMVRGLRSIISSHGTRTRRDLPEAARMVAAGVIDYRYIVSRHYGFDEVTAGYQQLHDGQITDRAVIDMSL